MTGRRNLPGPIIDRIREGVPRKVLRRARCGGDCAIWEALVATAMSAIQRGWPFSDWMALLDDPRSRLGSQAKIKGKGYAVLPIRSYLHRLESAWARATERITEHPAADYFAGVQDRIAEARAWVDEAPFIADHRVLMIDACGQAAKLGTWQPALPWRRTSERTGLNGRRIRDGYSELCEDGALTLVARGRPGKGRSSGKANIYRLPDEDARTLILCGLEPHPVSGERPKEHDLGEPRPKEQDQMAPFGTMEQDPAAPRPKEHDLREEDETMVDDTRVRLTVEGATLERVLAALQREGLAVSAADLPDNVVPIRREGEQA